MVLPSQQARPISPARLMMSHSRRRNWRPAIALGALVVVAGSVIGGVLLVRGGPEDADGSTRDHENAAVPGPRSPRPDGAPDPQDPSLLLADRSGSSPVNGRSPDQAAPIVADPPAPPGTQAGTAATDPATTATPAGLLNPPGTSPPDVLATLRAAEEKLAAKDLVTARELFNRALADERSGPSDKATARARLQAINDDLLFSPRIDPRDPFTTTYTVAPGDSLTSIVASNGLFTHRDLVVRVNRLANPNVIRLGQKLKLVRGPFHAVVSKGEFRLDVYAGPPESPASWTFVRSFRVGLGEQDSTPTGRFVVRKNSKLENPYWVNPRTGERFDATDPKNPIGERWIGLRGVGDAEVYEGYGIHGTIDPDSVGQMRSMGCVRLLPDDVAFLYELLAEDVSEVRIDP